MKTGALGCTICTLESEELIVTKNSSVSSTISSNVTEMLPQRLRLLNKSGAKITGNIAAS